MNIKSRLKHIEVQMNKQREKEMDGVIFYDARTGVVSGAYSWKPGDPHTRKIKLSASGVPCPAGFTGTIIIDDIMKD